MSKVLGGVGHGLFVADVALVKGPFVAVVLVDDDYVFKVGEVTEDAGYLPAKFGAGDEDLGAGVEESVFTGSGPKAEKRGPAMAPP